VRPAKIFTADQSLIVAHVGVLTYARFRELISGVIAVLDPARAGEGEGDSQVARQGRFTSPELAGRGRRGGRSGSPQLGRAVGVGPSWRDEP